MKQTKQILFSALAIILLLLSLMRGLTTDRDLSLDSNSSLENSHQVENKELVKGEAYYDLEDVAAYIHQYQSLPANYITKKQAQSKGWQPGDPYYVVIPLVIVKDNYLKNQGDVIMRQTLRRVIPIIEDLCDWFIQMMG